MRRLTLNMFPDTSNIALKEWAVAIKAMSVGNQVLTIRKGGIHKDDINFRVTHREFLLYPTYEHQNHLQLKKEYHKDLKASQKTNNSLDQVKLEFWCRVTNRFEIRTERILDILSGYHVWTNEYAHKRLHWRPKNPLTVAFLRVYRLQNQPTIPVLKKYTGCKSWIDLDQKISLEGMNPILSDQEYTDRVNNIQNILSESNITT